MDGFREAFGGLAEPRSRVSRYDLTALLFIALATMLCGGTTACDVAEFARSKRAWLEEAIDLPEGDGPSHDTFSRVFRLLDPEAFEAAFTAFATRMGGGLSGVVSVDGKALKGAYARGRKAAPLHLITIWAARARLVAGQRLAPGRNEARGMIEALGLLDAGCTVTADAMHCRPDTARTVLARGADYCFALRGNQPRLLAEAERLLDAAAREGGRAVTGPERGHDRIETRQAVVAAARLDLEGAACVARVTATQRAGGRTSVHERTYVLSRHVTPKEALAITRAHWGVENEAHWCLDTVLAEDVCRARKDHAPRNLALLRRLALNALRHHPAKLSLPLKTKRASWNDAFLRELFAFMR